MFATPFVRTHVVRKRHKRLWIDILESGKAIYTPPSFIRLVNRQPMIDLAARLTAGADYIDSVMEFETNAPRNSSVGRAGVS
jgi:hypothetical protein